jgi:hypothetical protein
MCGVAYRGRLRVRIVPHPAWLPGYAPCDAVAFGVEVTNGGHALGVTPDQPVTLGRARELAVGFLGA